MEKMSEQELQELLAMGIQPSDDSLNSKTYQALFSELKKEPANGLPYNFSAKVTAQLRLQQDFKLSFKPYLITMALIFAALAIVFFTVPLLPKQYSAGFLSAMVTYKWPVLFAITGFILVKYFDQRLQFEKLIKVGSK